ncbi:uncharacterized protein [Leptinotarsa decemlineata]|uniref:uncharacterized protein n=1 Tax=Leptinotarsa decemlineata TaxID=7539 RepID=UPI003D304281
MLFVFQVLFLLVSTGLSHEDELSVSSNSYVTNQNETKENSQEDTLLGENVSTDSSPSEKEGPSSDRSNVRAIMSDIGDGINKATSFFTNPVKQFGEKVSDFASGLAESFFHSTDTTDDSGRNNNEEIPSESRLDGESEENMISIPEFDELGQEYEITTENGNNDDTSDSTTNTPTTEVDFMNENVTNIMDITTSVVEESTTSSNEEKVGSTKSTMDNSTRNENLQNVSTEQPSPGGDPEISIHINITETNGSSMKTEITTENGNNDNTSDSTTNTPTTEVNFMNGNVTNIIDITTSGEEESTTSSSEEEVGSTESTMDNSTRNENLQNVSTEQPSPGGDSEVSIHINITEINGSSMKTEITTENGNNDNTSYSTTNTPTTEVDFIDENVTNIIEITTSGVEESNTSSSEEEVISTESTMDNSTRNENLQNVSTEQPSPGGDSEVSIHINITKINGSSMKTEITTENGNNENTSYSTTNTPTTEVDFIDENVTNIIERTTSGVEESNTSSSEEEVISTESTMDNSTRNENLQNVSTEQPSPSGDSEVSTHINITEINGSSMKTEITTENGNNDNTSYSTTNTPTTEVDFIDENVTNIIEITTSGVEESNTSSSEEEVISTESTMDNSTRNENLQDVSTEQSSPGGDSEVSIHINITEINGSSMKTDITTENGNNGNTSYSTTNTPTTEVDFINENVTNIIEITTSGVEESNTSSSEEEVISTESTMDNSTRNENLQNVSTEQPSPGGDSEVSIHINITEINGSSMKTEITTENGNNDNTSYSTTNTPTTEVDFINENVTNIIEITTSGVEESNTSSSEEEVISTESTMDNSTRNENLQNVSTEQPSPGGDSEVSIHINITEINGSSMKTEISTENGNNDNTSDSTTNTPTTQVDFMNENITNIIDITTSGVEESNTSSSEEEVISTESTMDNSTRNENLQNVSTEQPSPGGDSEVSIHINITEINGSSMKTEITTENGNNDNTSYSTTNTPTTEVDFIDENVTNIIEITTSGVEESNTSSSEEEVISTESTMDNSTRNENLQNVSTEQPSPGGDSEVSIHINITEINGSSMKTEITTENGNNDNTSDSTTNTPTTQVDFMNENITNIIDITTSGVEESNTSSSEEEVISTESTMDNSTRNENRQDVSTEQSSPGGDSEVSIHINITEINGSSIKTDITTENGNNGNTSYSTTNTPTTEVDFINENVTNIIEITTSGVEESNTSSSEKEVISTESTMDNSTRNGNLQNVSTEQPSPGGDSEVSIHINITEINGSSMKTEITTENGNDDNTSYSTTNTPTTEVDFIDENVTNIIEITTSGVEESNTSSSEEEVISTESTMDNSTRNRNLQNVSTEQPSPGGDSEVSIHINITEINGSSMKTEITTENGNDDNTSYSTTNTPTTEVDFIDENVTNIIEITTSGVEESNTSSSEEEVISTESTMDNSTRNENLQNVSTEQPSPGGDSEVSIHINITEINGSSMKTEITTENGNNDNTSYSTTNTPTTEVDFIDKNVTNIIEITSSGVEESNISSSEEEVISTESTMDNSTRNENLQDVSTEQSSPGGDSEVSIHINITEINGSSIKTDTTTENGNNDNTSYSTTNTPTTEVDFINENVTNIIEIITSGVEESNTSSSEEEVISTESTMDNSTRNENLQDVPTEQSSPGGDSEVSIHINITEINGSSMKTEITTENGNNDNTSYSTTNTPTTEVDFINENVTNIIEITTSGVEESNTSSSEEKVISTESTMDNSTRNENLQNVSTEQPSPGGDSVVSIHINITEINGSSMKTEITTENGNDDNTSYSTTNTPTTEVDFINENVTNIIEITTSGVEESNTSSSEEEVISTESAMDNSTRNENFQNVSTEQPSPGGDSEVSIHINITEINGSSMKTEITTENGNNDNTSYSTTNTPTTEVDFIDENVTNIIEITTSGVEESNTSSSEEEVISTESTMDNSTRNENLQNVSTEQPSPGGDSEVSIHINITEINGSSMKTEITTENGNNDNTSYSTTNTPTTEVDFVDENVTNIIEITTSGVEESNTSSSEEEVISTESTMDNSTRNENLQDVSTEQSSPGGDSEVSIHINITEINGSSIKTDITTENGNNGNTSYSTTNTPTTQVDFMNENVTNIIDLTTSGVEESNTSSSEEEVISTESTMDNSTRNENLQNVSTEQPSPSGDSEVSIHINITEINGSSRKTEITTENENNDNTSDSTTNTPTTQVDFMNENVTNIIDITTSGVEESTTSSNEEEVDSTKSTMNDSTRDENLQNVSTEQPSPGGDSEISIHINITEINGSSMKTEITTENVNNDNTSDSTTNTPTTQVDFMNENVTNIIDITTSGVEESTTSSNEEEVDSTKSTMNDSTRDENLQNVSTEQPSPGGDSEISIHINITEINGSSMKTEITTENGNNDNTSDSTTNTPTTQVDFMNENVTNIIDITTSGVEETTTSSNEGEVDSTKSTIDISTGNENLQNISTEKQSPGSDAEIGIHINITEINGSSMKTEITTENGNNDNTSGSTMNTLTTQVAFMNENVTNIIDITTSGVEESTTSSNEEEVISTESTMDNSTRNENLQNVSTEQPSPGGDSEISIHINITEINGSSIKTDITTENGNNYNTSDSTTNTPTTQVDFMNENSTNIIDITTSGVEETTTSSNEGEVDSTKSTIDISTGNENLQNISTEKQFPGGDAEISIHINITEINGSSMKTEITTENGNDDDTSDSTTETRTTGVITLSNEEEVSSTKISTDISTRNENLLSISTEKPSPGGDSQMSIHINVTEIIGSNIKNKITTESGVDENTSDSTTNTPTTEVDFMNGNVTNIIDITTSGVEESTSSSSEEEVISTESTMDNSTRNENLQNVSTEQPSPGGDSEISIHINITEINGSSIKTDITTKNGNNDNTSDSTRNTPTTQVDFMNKNVTNIIDITTSGVEESTTSSSQEEVISTESTMDNSTRNENLQNFSTEQPSPGGDSEISIHINITEINGSSIKTDITRENGNNDKTSDSTRNAPTTQVDFMNENVTNIIDITTSGVEESTTSSNEEEVDSTKSTMNDSTRKESLQNVSTEQPSPGGDSEVSIHINITEINGSSMKTEITTENGNNDNTSYSTTNTPTTEVVFINENVTNIIGITTSGLEESNTSSSEEEVISTESTMDNSTRNENLQNVSTEQPSPGGDSEVSIHINITKINGSSMKTEITTENGNNDNTSDSTTNTPTTQVDFMNENVTNIIDITTSGVEETTTSSNEGEVDSTKSTIDISTGNENLQNISTEKQSPGSDAEISIHINITEINGSSMKTEITTENGNSDNTSGSTTNTPTTQRNRLHPPTRRK